jgi:hypothetical protein
LRFWGIRNGSTIFGEDVLRAGTPEYGIIAVPEDAKYRPQDMLTVIAYAANSRTQSPETRGKRAEKEEPKASVPSVDTVFNCNKTANSVKGIPAFFRCEDTNHAANCAIDSHTEGYYGEKNAEGMKGIKNLNGTYWGTRISPSTGWAALGIPATSRMSELEKDYAALVEGAVRRLRAIGLLIRGNFRGSRALQSRGGFSILRTAITIPQIVLRYRRNLFSRCH